MQALGDPPVMLILNALEQKTQAREVLGVFVEGQAGLASARRSRLHGQWAGHEPLVAVRWRGQGKACDQKPNGQQVGT